MGLIGDIFSAWQNKDLARYSYSKDVEMWNRQNLYNSPKMQMQRFKEAGLNPALIYGQGTSGNATQMPRYNAPTVKYDVGVDKAVGILGMFQDFKAKQAQTNNLNKQGELLEIEKEKKAWDLTLSKAFGWNRQAYGNTKLWNESEESRVRGQKLGQDVFVKDQTMVNEILKKNLELDKYNLDIALQRKQNELKQIDLDFANWMKSGDVVGKFGNVLLRMLRK